MKIDLSKIDPRDTGELRDKDDAAQELVRLQDGIRDLHARLFAEGTRSLLVILQGMDTSGKDGVVRSLFAALNPHAARPWSFKAPTAEELAHDFLWRCHGRVPAHGEIVIFNRSHYEDVVTASVQDLIDERTRRQRYDAINAFERLLEENGTTLLKFFLHITKDEQKERLEKRLSDPAKRWKFDAADLDVRKRWDAYMAAYEEAVEHCSDAAPWHIVPADRKWYRNIFVARSVHKALEKLDPSYPDPRADFAGLSIEG